MHFSVSKHLDSSGWGGSSHLLLTDNDGAELSLHNTDQVTPLGTCPASRGLMMQRQSTTPLSLINQDQTSPLVKLVVE